MSDPTVNCRIVNSTVELTTNNNVKILLRKETYFTFPPTNRAKRNVFVVNGTVLGKRPEHNYEASWELICPETFPALIDAALRPIGNHLAERSNGFPVSPLDLEIYSDVTDWLRIGWIEKLDSTFYGYVRFTKDGETLKAHFQTYNGLLQIRS